MGNDDLFDNYDIDNEKLNLKIRLKNFQGIKEIYQIKKINEQ